MHEEQVLEAVALTEGETTSFWLAEGESAVKAAEELKALLEARPDSGRKRWIVYPNKIRVVVTWLEKDCRLDEDEEEKKPMLVQRGKWADIADRLADLPTGEEVDLQPFEGLNMLIFKRNLYAMTRTTGRVKQWRYSMKEIQRESGPVLRVKKEGHFASTPTIRRRHSGNGYHAANPEPISLPAPTLEPITPALSSKELVMRDLEERKNVLQAEIAKIDYAIDILAKLR